MEYQERKVKIFVSYSHDDDDLLEVLKKHLAPLRRHRAIDLWTDCQIDPGTQWTDAIRNKLEAADLILLLISSSFLASEFCYEQEMTRALARDNEGTARVVPIILRPCDWMESPFAKLQALPSRAKPITMWNDRDAAMTEVAIGIRRVLDSLRPSRLQEGVGTLATPKPIEVTPVFDGPFNPLHAIRMRKLVGLGGNETAEESAMLRPRFKAELVARLSSELDEAYRQRDALLLSNLDSTAIEGRILDLKRRLRHGPQLQPGEFLGDGRFQLVHSIGQGGFATVWLANDRRGNSPVAIKVLHGQFSTSEERRERLFRGARQMLKLDHPHIVKVISEPKVEEGWAYFVMEYLEGGDFRQAVLNQELGVVQRVEILRKVALALDFAHSRSVVHRDIKPANILLDKEKRPKLADFDLVLAKDTTGLTRSGAGMGTYHYAAPESMDAAAGVTASCDVYSLAATSVFAIAGRELGPRFLFQREFFLQELGLSDRTLGVLLRGLHLQPERRFLTAVDLMDDLRLALALTSNPVLVGKKRDARGVLEPNPGRRPGRPERLNNHFWKVRTCDGIVPLWRKIPAGYSWIGSSKDETYAHEREERGYRIEVARDFWLASVPVTNAQYALFRSQKKTSGRHHYPVVGVSWEEAQAFCIWLQEIQGLRGARLPTEEEWEYACRAGTSTRYWSGDSEEDLSRVGWYVGNTGGLRRVGEKKPNPWGLYDMHGNVWEWTANRWKTNRFGPTHLESVDAQLLPTDLVEPIPRVPRAVRGGGFDDSALRVRSAARNLKNLDHRSVDLGFRVLLPFSPNDD